MTEAPQSSPEVARTEVPAWLHREPYQFTDPTERTRFLYNETSERPWRT